MDDPCGEDPYGEDARVIARQMEVFFGGRRRFEFIKLVAFGAYGTTCRIRFNDPAFPYIKSFLVKRAFDGWDHREALVREKEMLEVCSLSNYQ